MLKKIISIILFLLIINCVNAETITRYDSDFVISNNQISFRIKDRMNNERLEIDSENITAKFNNLPYGQEIQKNNLKYGFSNKEKDETDQHYFNARYYDSDSGRFLSGDSVEDNHAYSFVNNNPMNYIDPDGRDTLYVADLTDSDDSINAIKTTVVKDNYHLIVNDKSEKLIKHLNSLKGKNKIDYTLESKATKEQLKDVEIIYLSGHHRYGTEEFLSFDKKNELKFSEINSFPNAKLLVLAMCTTLAINDEKFYPDQKTGFIDLKSYDAGKRLSIYKNQISSLKSLAPNGYIFGSPHYTGDKGDIETFNIIFNMYKKTIFLNFDPVAVTDSVKAKKKYTNYQYRKGLTLNDKLKSLESADLTLGKHKDTLSYLPIPKIDAEEVHKILSTNK